MERFITVSNLAEKRDADTACGALESGKIPVILQHVEASNDNYIPSFRLLVPEKHAVTALGILNRLQSA